MSGASGESLTSVVANEVRLASEPRRNPVIGLTQRLSPAASVVLDIVRFIAAVIVAIGHYTMPEFSAGLPSLMTAASGPVGVFFVLSGFVIRYITQYRSYSFSEYVVDRAPRLFSVVVPALCFTGFVILLVSDINPALLP